MGNRIECLKQGVSSSTEPYEQLLQDINHKLAVDENHPTLLGLKAEVLYQMSATAAPKGEEKPVFYLKKAVKSHPENAEANSNLAVYLAQVLEEYDESLPYFKKALSLDASLEIYDVYAEALAYSGEPEQAIEMLKASDADPETVAQSIAEIEYEFLS